MSPTWKCRFYYRKLIPMNLKHGSPDNQTYSNISLLTFQALSKGAEFCNVQGTINSTSLLLVYWWNIFFLTYYMHLNVYSFVSCHLTPFLQRVCLHEFYWNSTYHFNAPAKWTNSKAFPMPTTSKKKPNFYTAFNLRL